MKICFARNSSLVKLDHHEITLSANGLFHHLGFETLVFFLSGAGGRFRVHVGQPIAMLVKFPYENNTYR